MLTLSTAKAGGPSGVPL